MKVAFVNPVWFEKTKGQPFRRGVRAGSRWPMTMGSHYVPDCFVPGGYVPFPMFLSSAAGWLEARHPEIEVHIRDSIARGESEFRFWQWLTALSPDYIVFESAPSSWANDKRLIEAMEATLPKSKVILCGTAVTKGLEVPDNVSAMIHGEYEKGVENVVTTGFSGEFPHDFLTTAEMNGPNGKFLWDEGAANNYFDENPKGQQMPQLQLWGSRGCSFRCNFCAWPAVMTNDDPTGSGKRVMRYYSADWIEAYIRERMAKMPGLKCVYFDDDTGNISDKHTVEICGVMRKIGLPWSMMCRADTSSREVWQEMKDSGCFGVKIGFESGVQRVVTDIIGKGLDLEAAREIAIWLRSIGLTVHGTFMVGHPGETQEEAQATVDFIKKLYADGGLDTNQLSGTATISGTPLANLKAGETQKRYPGAKKDETWHEDLDGQKKVEALISR